MSEEMLTVRVNYTTHRDEGSPYEWSRYVQIPRSIWDEAGFDKEAFCEGVLLGSTEWTFDVYNEQDNMIERSK